MTMSESNKENEDCTPNSLSSMSRDNKSPDKHRHSETSQTSVAPDSSPNDTEPEEKPVERRLTAFERLSHDLSNDQRVLKEITLGRRIGFYRIRGELGSGNFSQVRMGIHALTHGTYKYVFK